MDTLIWILVAAVLAAAAGYFVARMLITRNAKSNANLLIADAQRNVEEARREADVIREKKLLEAKEESLKLINDAEREAAKKMQRVQSAEARTKQIQMQLRDQQSEISKGRNELDQRAATLDNRERQIEQRGREAEQVMMQAREELEHISGLSAEEARDKLIESLKDEAKTAAQSYINDIMDDAKMTAGKEAKRIVIQSIQRVATETAVENAVTVFHIDNDEIKGKIIGREGRNIRALEAATGVEIIVDDTP